jgi:fluoroacetyl-CoA thioesterase
MTFDALKPGLAGQLSLVVTEEHTAKHLGSGSVQVLATPQMILLMEQASVAAIDHLLPEGYRTVGIGLDVRHLAPTPVGFEVRATSEVIEVDGRRLTCRVQVHDGVELVGEGIHRRAIIDVRQFAERVAKKEASLLSPRGKGEKG